MMMFLRAALVLGGLGSMLIGSGFLIAPVELGAMFGVEAGGPQGLSSLRADFTAFFWVAGGSLAWGGWRRNGAVLLVAAALMGIALLGRVVGLILDGSYAGAFGPMVVEAVTLSLAITGSRMFGRGGPG
jgi:hypothetical protein